MSNSQFTRDVLHEIEAFENSEIKASVRLVKIPSSSFLPRPSPKHTIIASRCTDMCYDCEQQCPSQPSTAAVINQSRVLQLPTITEDDGPPPVHNTLHSFELRLSNNSVHKKRRGLIRRINQHKKKLVEQQEVRGLKRCRIVQNDSGANRCITNEKGTLLKFKCIPALPIGGREKGEPALYATGTGYLPFRSDNGDILLIPCLYCSEAECTLISPTAITKHYGDLYYGWNLHGDHDTNTGYLEFLNRDGINHTKYSSFKENDLWYHYAHDTPSGTEKPIIHRLSQRAAFEVWHHRFGHANPRTVEQMYRYATGVPKLKANPLYKCATCLACKTKKTSHSPTKSVKIKPPQPEEHFKPGQHLHMDFGFVRGSDWSSKSADDKLITSIDGFRSYLIVVDRATRYKWVFLTTTKSPPLKEVDSILQKFKHSVVNLHTTVRTDQGGELGKSTKFRKLVAEHGWTYEPTGSNSSAQNGIAEKPNQDLKNSCKCLLHAAGLGSQYWSYALNHSVYLANRLLHRTISMTPYQALHHRPPNLSHLRVFGARCYYKYTKKSRKIWT